MGEVTTLLSAIAAGQPEAMGRLYELLYQDLRRLAHARVRRSGDLTLLDTTSLVHESFLRFEKLGSVKIGDRMQFMAYAARVMRSVVVDAVRSRQADRRGGEAVHVDVDDSQLVAGSAAADTEVMRVHEALEELATIDARLVQVVEMRYFAGMTEAETAEALGVGVRTVSRDWEKARMFLQTSLR